MILTWFRAYDANSGTWLSADPIGEEGGLNLYGYVNNDPISELDPLGLCIELKSIPILSQLLPIITGTANMLWYLAQDNQPDDGYMHCVTSCRMKMSELGDSGIAKLFGDLHECIDPSDDTEDDQIANAAGRKAANSSGPKMGQSCHERCVNAGYNP